MANEVAKKPEGALNRRDVLRALTTVPAALVPIGPAVARVAKRQARPPVPQSGTGEYQRQTFDEH